MNESIIFLQNQDVWHEMMQFSIRNCNIKIIERNDELKISGHYSKINDAFVMLYRENENLYLYLKNRKILLSNKKIKFTFERIGKNNRFSINKGSAILFSIIYPSCIFDPVNIADIDFNSDREEDQDFFLFVYNVMQDNDWQNRIYL